MIKREFIVEKEGARVLQDSFRLKLRQKYKKYQIEEFISRGLSNQVYNIHGTTIISKDIGKSNPIVEIFGEKNSQVGAIRHQIEKDFDVRLRNTYKIKGDYK